MLPNLKYHIKEAHHLRVEDIEKILDNKPATLIIGTGYYGLMKVPLELIKYLESMGIEVIIKKTKDACDEYNTLYKKKKVIAAFHLTC